MIQPELINYIKLQRGNNVPDEMIQSELVKANWSQGDIVAAFATFNPAPQASATTSVNPPPAPNTGTVPSPRASVNAEMFGVPKETQDHIKASLQSPRTISIIKSCIVYGAIGGAISEGGRFIAYNYFYMGGVMGELNRALGTSVYDIYSPSTLIINIFWAAVAGAIWGAVLALFYQPIVKYVSQLTGNAVNTPFKIVFYPKIIVFVLTSLSTIFLGVAGIITTLAEIVGSYVFASGVNKVLTDNQPSN